MTTSTEEMEDISSACQAEMSFIPYVATLWENPPVSSALEILRTRLQERLDAKGISPRSLSLDLPANHAYVSQILRGKGGMPSADRLARMAELLDTSVDYLTGRSSEPDAVVSEVGLISDAVIPWREQPHEGPGIPLVGTGDCADLEVCDEGGHMVTVERSSFDPDYHVRYIQRPPSLRGALDLYAIYFHGSSMEPRYEAGDVGIVDPRRPARAGDYVVVQLNSGASDDVVSVLVKRLVRQSSKELVLQQLNPPLTFTVPPSRVARVHRIIPPTELLF